MSESTVFYNIIRMTEIKKMGKKLMDKVSWVGKIDWELKKFHGNEYSMHRGSSYNPISCGIGRPS